MSTVTQQVTGNILYFPLIIVSIMVFLGVSAILWRRGKTIEALLVWVSMWLCVIAFILVFR